MSLYGGIGNYKPIQMSFVLYPFYFAGLCSFFLLFKDILLVRIDIIGTSSCMKFRIFPPLWPDKQFGTGLR